VTSTAKQGGSTAVRDDQWVVRWQGATVVVKYGGHAMVDRSLQQAFASDVVLLRRVGLRPVVVHGGGPHISSMLSRLGVTTTFVDGLRVTTPEVMDVARMVLTGQVQREVVGAINAHGPLAVGLSGEDAHVLTATRRESDSADLGLVGDVQKVNPDYVRSILDQGLVPVVSSIARGVDGTTYNVNADTAAAALAAALGARRLVVLTDVEGVYAQWPDPSTVLPRLTTNELRQLLPSTTDGMVPKLQACLAAVDGGVADATVLDGRVPHSLLASFGAIDPPGTVVVGDNSVPTSVGPVAPVASNGGVVEP
jgi:acetylglutamate kinase